MLLDDLAAMAEVAGVVGILASLVYLNIQFRQSKKNDEREAAFQMIRSFQTAEFSQMLRASYDLPAGLTRKGLDEHLGGDLSALYMYFATWESLGIMVRRRQISLDLVCDFFSHSILQAWHISETYVLELRKDLGRETPWEWFQWLAETVSEFESRQKPVPAYVEFKGWK